MWAVTRGDGDAASALSNRLVPTVTAAPPQSRLASQPAAGGGAAEVDDSVGGDMRR
jgi:hypothetical protein